MLSAQEAFKIGFLSRCVEDRLTPDQMLDRVKRAHDLFEKTGFIGGILQHIANKGVDLGAGALSATAQYGIPAAIATPPILGGLAGYGLARATDVNDTDVADIKDREVIDEYRRQAEKLRQVREQRLHRKPTRSFAGRALI